MRLLRDECNAHGGKVTLQLRWRSRGGLVGALQRFIWDGRRATATVHMILYLVQPRCVSSLTHPGLLYGLVMIDSVCMHTRRVLKRGSLRTRLHAAAVSEPSMLHSSAHADPHAPAQAIVGSPARFSTQVCSVTVGSACLQYSQRKPIRLGSTFVRDQRNGICRRFPRPAPQGAGRRPRAVQGGPLISIKNGWASLSRGCSCQSPSREKNSKCYAEICIVARVLEKVGWKFEGSTPYPQPIRVIVLAWLCLGIGSPRLVVAGPRVGPVGPVGLVGPAVGPEVRQAATQPNRPAAVAGRLFQSDFGNRARGGALRCCFPSALSCTFSSSPLVLLASWPLRTFASPPTTTIARPLPLTHVIMNAVQ
ncbi:hypothetical protein L1887_62980 [Cichorium endivia]|nr:hypothetical protein L1887_62980 [Cichorium endivia]